MSTLKEKINGDGPAATCVLCTIPSAVVTQAIAAAGADSVIIDMEHGAVDYGSAHAMIAATQGFDCAPLVRISKIDAAEVKRALDVGAEGICFPLARTAEDVRHAIATLHYPPNGVRGFGPFISHSRWASASMPAYAADMDERVFSMILIETAEAIENIEEICAVPGIDLIVLAGFDLSSAMGIPGQFDHPDFIAAQERLETAANAAGLPLSAVALRKEQADEYKSRGYRVLASFDVLFLKSGVSELRSWLK